MVTGFGILVPLGVLVARTMKVFDPLWFHLHRGIQVDSYMLTYHFYIVYMYPTCA